jgi:oligoendopeptidase F
MSEEQKNPVGRPTEYDPSYCDKVRELGKLGKSFEQMSAQLNVSYRTLCRWRDSHEEFCHALEDAQALAQSWWEEMAQAYMLEHKDGERLNASLWSRSMAARFPKNYSDRVKQEISGPGGVELKTGFILSFEEPKQDGNDSGS